MCNQPCETCAFTEGSDANLEPHNAIKGQLCVLGGIPFYCHHGQEWWTEEAAKIPPSKIRELQIPICQGWRREVAKLAAIGHFRKGAAITKAFAQIGLGELQVLCSKNLDDEDKEEAKRVLEAVFKNLIERKKRAMSENKDNAI